MDFNNMFNNGQKNNQENNQGKQVNFGNRKPGSQKNFKEMWAELKKSAGDRDKKRKGLNPLIILAITLVIMFIYFFATLPALNLMAPEFYAFLVMAVLVFNGLNMILGSLGIFKTVRISIIILALLIGIPAIGGFISQPLFRAKAYANLIQVDDANFAETVKEITYDKVPVVDREAAAIIGQRQMGSVKEVVSQFEINDNYTQINVNNIPVRVSPLAYADIIKYFINSKNGIPYYVQVDMATQEADLIPLVKPIMYSKSDILLRNIFRRIRFQHPTKMFGETNFEVDDSGNAYYITSVLTKRIGFFNGTDVKGALVTDASTGESTYYDTIDVPMWVDRVYPSDMIIQQLDWRGRFKDGYFNSVIGQKNVTKTTVGYNYIPLNDDIYLFTGVTSIRGDSSNLGFYFSNSRTKETKMFSVPSADEVSAMNSATGQIQEKNYVPAFPVLLNIKNRPTYLIGLKDNSGLAKQFALVDAENYQQVTIGDTVQKVINEYNLRTDTSGEPTKDAIEKSIVIADIQTAVIDGNTMYFIRATNEEMVYVGSAKKLGSGLAFIKAGDTLKIYGNPLEKQFDILEVRP